MNLPEIFEYNDTNIKRGVLMKHKLKEKIDYFFDYFFKNKRIPINKVKKDNTFDFGKLKFSVGKNYDWFFLVKDNLTILVRQYRSHFTIYSKITKEGVESYFEKPNVFTFYTNDELITDDKLNDQLCDNPFLHLSQLLPQIIEHLTNDKFHLLSNTASLKHPKYIEIEEVYGGGDDVDKLDTLLFACDELFQKFLECYAENEMLEYIKTLNVGDTFGTSYTITEIHTNVKDDYYHSVGLKYDYNCFTGVVEKKWDDVYSLTRWKYKDLHYNPIVEDIQQFVYANYETVFNELVDKSQVWGVVFASQVIGELHKRFDKEIEYGEFNRLLPDKFKEFIEQLYYIKKRTK